MNTVDKRIIKFIQQHHVLTLATTKNNIPWCCNCFYTYVQEDNMLVVLSDKGTRHVDECIENINVAGSIVLETSIIGKIRGIQFTGIMIELKDDELKLARKAYLFKFPYALLTKTIVWGIKIQHIKMTDNRLGFGEKIYWNS